MRTVKVNQLYLDLLVKAVCGELSDAVLHRTVKLNETESGAPEQPFMISKSICAELLRQADEKFRPYLKSTGKTAMEFCEMDASLLFGYINWMNPMGSPHTMCGEENALKVLECVEDIFANDIPGDFIETGVWKGGMTVLMRGALKAYECHDRAVWVADSFEGLPKPDPETALKDAIFWFLMTPLQQLAIPQQYVKALFERYGLMDQQVRFLKGWFCDTLPEASIGKLALLRMDGDLYESTRDTLEHLYPRLSTGGYIIVDDYGVPCGCRRAVDEYRERNSIQEPMKSITDASVYWKKTRPVTKR